MATTSSAEAPPVVLLGYDSSPFTTKVKLALKLKQIPYSKQQCQLSLSNGRKNCKKCPAKSEMNPRSCGLCDYALRSFHHRSLNDAQTNPVGQLQHYGQEDSGFGDWKGGESINLTEVCRRQSVPQIYIDTSLILEALEHYFPTSAGYGSIYPSGQAATYRALIRGFASYWTDRPFFRVTTGLIPSTVWRTHFGVDRANLIGHQLDAEKLERKVPQNLSGLDLQLSLLEPLFVDASKKWLFEGEKPSAADLVLWYQLDWGEKIARGEGIKDLTEGETREGDGEGMGSVFNTERYPGLSAWFERFRSYVEQLPVTDTRVERHDEAGVKSALEKLKGTELRQEIPLLPTPAGPHHELDRRTGLVLGVEVSIAPDDTGRDSPTLGTLLAMTPEEVVITPQKTDGAGPTVGEVRVHFPRVSFAIRPVGQARL